MSTEQSMSHSYNDMAVISKTMLAYKEEWNQSMGEGKTQTTFFRENIPEEVIDFTDPFRETKLNRVFTNQEIQLSVPYGFNCNHLFRTSKDVPHVLVYSTPSYSVVHPLGEPGRDLGVSAYRVSHLMIITCDNGPITLNELLPSDHLETYDLVERLTVGDCAYTALRINCPVSECGDRVKEKAENMGLPASTGIRDFMVHQIMKFDADFRAGIPGYKLLNLDSNDIAGDEGQVKTLVDTIFMDEGLNNIKCIQPPWKNTQLLSHIHMYRVNEVPQSIKENYVDVNIIRNRSITC